VIAGKAAGMISSSVTWFTGGHHIKKPRLFQRQFPTEDYGPRD